MRLPLALSVTLLAGCGGGSLWPFGSGGTELSRVPPNAVAYKCDGGKTFYVRTIEDGAVWLIAPDRELRLSKSASGWGAGRVALQVDGDNASLLDPPASFSGCKRAAKN